uniref:Sema domain-containing protein n=1 Tax=Rhabditophanes sp. KR3021 TaxID=114890 RepID=A0AC35TJ43_9BILA
MKFNLVISFVGLLVLGAADSTTQLETEQKKSINIVDDTSLFLKIKNESPYPDHLRILYREHNEFLIIGGRNVAYNVSIISGQILSTYTWLSSKKDEEECVMKGRSLEECHNYIRVVSRQPRTTKLLICGTNSFKPLCRVIEERITENAIKLFQFSGVGIVSYDPLYQTTFVRDGDLMYASSVTDFDSTDPLIYRRNVSLQTPTDLGIRTVKDDFRFLNSPQFVGSFLDSDFIYFWLREEAIECDNCDPIIYSRVVRVCRSDKGGPRQYSNEWTSFVKARLNCSISGRYPFYFDHIESIAFNKDRRTVYATFTSSLAGIAQSAICGYDLGSINDIFTNSVYSGMNNQQNVWRMKKASNSKGRYRPGSCLKDSKQMSENDISWAKANALVRDVVPNKFGNAQMVTLGTEKDRYLAISVKSIKKDEDILYVGTDHGTVKKMLVRYNSQSSPTFISQINLKLTDGAIKNLIIVEENLVVLTESEVLRLNLDFCLKLSFNCGVCLGDAENDGCVWNERQSRCSERIGSGNLTENVEFVKTCPKIVEIKSTFGDNNLVDSVVSDVGIGKEKWSGFTSGFNLNSIAFLAILALILVIGGCLIVFAVLRRRMPSDGKSEKSLSIATSYIGSDSAGPTEWTRSEGFIDAYKNSPFEKNITITPLSNTLPFIPSKSMERSVIDSPRMSANNDDISIVIEGHATTLLKKHGFVYQSNTLNRGRQH